MVNRSFMAIAAVAATAFASTFLCMGCSSHEGDEDQLREDADSFAIYYYNWHFDRALKFCTPNSEPWLRFMASNVTQEDVDSLRAKEEDATVQVNAITYHGDGDCATVSVSVANFLQMDSLGKAPHRIEAATFSLPAVIHEGRWKVRMDSPLRSERRNRD